jgi:hypothetical protein
MSEIQLGNKIDKLTVFPIIDDIYVSLAVSTGSKSIVLITGKK